MSLLLGEPPCTVQINGMLIPINWDYRVSVQFDILMNGELTQEEKCLGAIALYYGHKSSAEELTVPGCVMENIEEAFDKIAWFFSGGKPEPKKGNRSVKKGYFFDFDDEYIYSAFMDQYDINLNEVETMHWWHFKALFRSLKEDNEISQIIKYRTVQIPSRLPREKKNFLNKMKEIYAPPVNTKVQQELNEIEEKLLNHTY